MKLLASGDWHLGAGGSLGREPGDRLADQRAVTEQIACLANERQADAVLLAGDLLEGPTSTPEQLEVIADFASACDCPIVAVSGNSRHDLATREVNGIAIFNRLPSMTVYSRPGRYELPDCTVVCLPWVSPARLVAASDGDVDRDRVNQRAAELLVKAARELWPAPVKPSVLMLHASISGASLPTGISTDDLREPVIPLEEIEVLGYTAIIASHIHVPQWVDANDVWMQPTHNPILDTHGLDESLVLYTGSPMSLNFGECSTPHGVWILDVDGEGAQAEFIPIDSRPLKAWKFDHEELVSQLALASDIGWDVQDGAIVKLTLVGTRAELRRVDLQDLKHSLLAAGAHTVKIETETIREDRARVQGVTSDLEPLEAFDAWAAASRTVTVDEAAAARDQMERDLEAVGA